LQHPGATRAYTVWNQGKNARDVNNGARIDYILPDAQLYATYVCPWVAPPDADERGGGMLDVRAAAQVTAAGVTAILLTPRGS
jgi:hypothetical protein